MLIDELRNALSYQFPWGGGYSHVCSRWVYAAIQCMVFKGPDNGVLFLFLLTLYSTCDPSLGCLNIIVSAKNASLHT